MKFDIETEYTEFKERTSQLSKALESLAAMLNKHGKGETIFGVKDNGEIVGQDISGKTLKDISDAVTSRIKPMVIPEIRVETYDGKSVIFVTVEGHNKPYSADGEYRIRSGNENKKIEPELIKELVYANPVELAASFEAINQELTFSQLHQLYIMRELTIDPITFPANAGLLTQDGKYSLLADILSDRNDCSIKVIRFAGKDKSEMIMRKEFGYKCMILAMLQVYEYVTAMNETKVVVSGRAQREEIPLFDDNSFREAWFNACQHNKWARMIPPAVYIFQDRIEIVSTGGLPADYPLEDFYHGISHPVNMRLQKIMGQLGIVEQTGHGVPEIVREYGREAFEITDSHITVTLRFAYELPEKKTEFSDITVSQKKVLSAIKNHPSITTSEMSRVTGYSVPRINQIIKELKDLGLIARRGSNKSGYWDLKVPDVAV